MQRKVISSIAKRHAGAKPTSSWTPNTLALHGYAYPYLTDLSICIYIQSNPVLLVAALPRNQDEFPHICSRGERGLASIDASIYRATDHLI